ncbi:MAG: hypothetical protein GX267_06450 [Fibrobacter sp.]|jgi:hypothetical protein|nr:hypothetical protein [Fibrobacter sp.]
MKINAAKVFSWFFIVIIAMVPVIQAVSELKEKRGIQCFNIFEDTFITPAKTARKISQLLEELKHELRSADSILTDNADVSESETFIMHLEEAKSISGAMRNQYVSINRYIDDTANAIVGIIDSLTEEISVLEEDPVSIKTGLSSIYNRIESISNKINRNGLNYIGEMIHHFFKYTAFNHHYLRKYEKEIENSSIFANSIRPIVQFVSFKLFGDPGEKAIMGKNGWMFYKPDVEYLHKPSVTDPRSKVVDYNSKPVMDDPVKVILDFRNQLSEMGIELLVMIVPGKPSIYPDLINPAIKVSFKHEISHSQHILKILAEKGVKTVDLFTPFLQERQRDSLFGDSLYLRTDTHWKNRGPRLAATSAASVIKQMPWFNDNFPKTEYTMDTVEVFRNGDIGVMTRLSDIKIGKMQLNLPLEKTKCYQVFSVIRDDSGKIISRNLYRDEYRKARILILGDSFSRIYQTDEPRSAGWISHLAYELSEPLASIVNDGGASTIVRQTLSKKASLLKGKKLVIWEFVERDLRFGEGGWKEVPITVSEKQH